MSRCASLPKDPSKQSPRVWSANKDTHQYYSHHHFSFLPSLLRRSYAFSHPWCWRRWCWMKGSLFSSFGYWRRRCGVMSANCTVLSMISQRQSDSRYRAHHKTPQSVEKTSAARSDPLPVCSSRLVASAPLTRTKRQIETKIERSKVWDSH